MSIDTQRIIALVPIKGHSERVPFKNIRNFAGKPLLYWILSMLQDYSAVKDIFVDTDNAEIKDIIHQYLGDSVKIIDRPESICGDYISMNQIIEYDLSVIKGDHFLQTHSTNPLLKVATIDQAINKYFSVINDAYDSLFSVNRFQSRFYDSKGNPINHDPASLIRTQDLSPVYEENSNFYIFSRDVFLQTSSRIGKKPYLFEVPKIECFDIDDESDFKMAEKMFLITNPQASS